MSNILTRRSIFRALAGAGAFIFGSKAKALPVGAIVDTPVLAAMDALERGQQVEPSPINSDHEQYFALLRDIVESRRRTWYELWIGAAIPPAQELCEGMRPRFIDRHSVFSELFSFIEINQRRITRAIQPKQGIFYD